MKKTTTPKKSTYPPPDLRKEWKERASDEIITLQDAIDESIDGLDLSEDTIKMIEKAVNKFKERLNDAIDLFEITPEIAVDDPDFAENFLDEIYYDKIILGESDLERMIEIVESNQIAGLNGVFVKIENLTQEIRLEEFLNELKENPCQLKLIA